MLVTGSYVQSTGRSGSWTKQILLHRGGETLLPDAFRGCLQERRDNLVLPSGGFRRPAVCVGGPSRATGAWGHPWKPLSHNFLCGIAGGMWMKLFLHLALLVECG
jgi:hypothetical protein